MQLLESWGPRTGHTANIGRMMTGCTVGTDAFGSPWVNISVKILFSSEEVKAYHMCIASNSTLHDHARFGAKVRRVPQNQVRDLPHFTATN